MLFFVVGPPTLWRRLLSSRKNPRPATPLAWSVSRPKKGLEYYEAQKETYKKFIAGTELAIPSVLEAVSHRIISLLATDVRTRRLIGISKKTMEEPRCEPENIVKAIKRYVGHSVGD